MKKMLAGVRHPGSMTRRRFLETGATAAIACSGGAAMARQPRLGPSPGDVALQGVNVIPMGTDAILENQWVSVVDGRIDSIRPNDGGVPNLRASARIVDAEGMYPDARSL